MSSHDAPTTCCGFLIVAMSVLRSPSRRPRLFLIGCLRLGLAPCWTLLGVQHARRLSPLGVLTLRSRTPSPTCCLRSPSGIAPYSGEAAYSATSFRDALGPVYLSPTTKRRMSASPCRRARRTSTPSRMRRRSDWISPIGLLSTLRSTPCFSFPLHSGGALVLCCTHFAYRSTASLSGSDVALTR